MILEVDKYAKITFKNIVIPYSIIIDREYLKDFFISYFESKFNEDLLIEQYKEEV